MQAQTIGFPARDVTLTALPPLSLYVHIPWCVRKCPYCDFNSHELRSPGATDPARSLDADLERSYVAALLTDLESALPQVWGRTLRTVFLGGGTPSLLSASALDQLLSGIRARMPLAADAEITLEANPGTFEAGKFVDFRAAGVNRLSIGIQSFNAGHLQALGRVHDDAQAHAAIEIAQRSFENFNLDLMYALPGQSTAQALADLEIALGYGPRHLSAYHLTIEPNTLFHRHPPQLPDDESAADMQEAIEARLTQAGYRHYETSAFAQPGYEARHNLNYWTFGDYLGIGAGAHGKISFSDRIVRQMRYKHPREYLDKAEQGTAVQQETMLTPVDLPFEFLMNALRLTDGFELPLFQERTGLPLQRIARELQEAQNRGLVSRDHMRLWPTLKGQRFLNDLLQLFLKSD